MKRIGLLIAFFTVLVLILPSLTAQDKKKDDDKTEKKGDAKKDDDKKDAKKDDEKKDAKKDDDKKDAKKDDAKKDAKKDGDKTDKKEKKEKEKDDPKKAPEKLVFSGRLKTKIISTNPNSTRDYTVEVQEVDKEKVYNLNVWNNQQMQSLAQQQIQIAQQKDLNARLNQMRNYQQAQFNYQRDLAQRQNNIYKASPLEVRGVENVKVRSLYPPVEFDDQGFQKKWTKKEIEERKDKTGLPGFPVELDALKSGQFVELYWAKKAPMTKKKKGPDDDPVDMRPEFVMIVILAEPKQ